MSLKIIETELSGVVLVEKTAFEDERGLFSKTYNLDAFADAGLDGIFEETFFSVSKKNVIRGMHYQKKPFEHDKLVSVISGEIVDVLVCIDEDSEEYGHSTAISLSSSSPYSVYIKKGYAHGFLTTSKEAVVLYQTTKGYSPESDTGIHFQSFDYDWRVSEPLISHRDMELPKLGEHEW
ncbi:MAG: dTDP-4-dehydrorhamnose 3,5-epimerase family protein [Neptuniibacter sp.]